MDSENEAIERNDCWELINLPYKHKIIGVKWFYKTKLKENGKINKFRYDWWLNDTSKSMV